LTLDRPALEAAILDRHGHVVAVNSNWRRRTDERGRRLPSPAVGASYLEACGAAAAELPVAAEAAAGVRAVAAGTDEQRRLLYASDCPGEEVWSLLRVSALGGDDGRRVLVIHEDVSELRRAEEHSYDFTLRVLSAQDEERRRIARELHDGTAPTLVGLSLDLARLAAELPEGGLHALANECAALCEQALRELRTVTFLLHPPVLEKEGLAQALRWLAEGFGKRAGIGVTVDAGRADGMRLADDVELALYRIAQEALTNVHRHSGSRTARVELVPEAGLVRLTVSDRGVRTAGWQTGSGGVGIPAMHQRLRALSGRLEIRTGTLGTSLTVVVPAHGAGTWCAGA
jgi:signal transduction histidine kinase